jgi:N-acetylglucosamine-6-phosphate deacetylase
MKYAIINAKIFTGEEVLSEGVIHVKDGIVVSVDRLQPHEDAVIVDLHGQNISAGFIDIQINGGFEHYFTQSPTEETLTDITEASRSFATTHILPCLISCSQETIIAALQTVRNFMGKEPAVLGMHLEGPFLNIAKKGAHSTAYIRTPTNHELEEIIRYGRDVIKLMTIAPEVFSDEQIEMLLDAGIVLSAGHSEMTYEQSMRAFSKGLQLVTHLFNAMTQMQHREPGLVGAALDNENVHTPVILDGAHCHYASARIANKIKRDKLFLLTDSSFLGRRKQEFNSEFMQGKLVNGYYRNAEGNLAGAAISMVDAVKNAIDNLNVSIEEAIKMATCRVAKAIKMDDKIGYIKPGYPASFSVFDDGLTEVRSLLL